MARTPEQRTITFDFEGRPAWMAVYDGIVGHCESERIPGSEKIDLKFWIREFDGLEVLVNLPQTEFQVAPGHHVRMAVGAGQKSSAPFLFGRNLTSGKWFERPEFFDWLILGRESKLVGADWGRKLLSRLWLLPVGAFAAWWVFFSNAAFHADALNAAHDLSPAYIAVKEGIIAKERLGGFLTLIATLLLGPTLGYALGRKVFVEPAENAKRKRLEAAFKAQWAKHLMGLPAQPGQPSQDTPHLSQ